MIFLLTAICELFAVTSLSLRNRTTFSLLADGRRGILYLAVGDLLDLAFSALDAHAVVLTGLDVCFNVSDEENAP